MTEYNTTLEKYNQMTPEETQEALSALATDLYGHTRWKTDIAALLGVTRDAVTKWFRDEKKPPYWTFLVIGGMLKNRTLENKLKALGKAARILAEYT
ncbi:MAG TPA: hypothetical protein ENK34_04080 [Rhodobacteraceae bacterium]|nr:hypothetical protein [Paracoccaceae bacterium]